MMVGSQPTSLLSSLCMALIATKPMKPSGVAQADMRRNRINAVAEWIDGKNVTAAMVGEHLCVSRQTALRYLNELKDERRVTSWETNGVTWWSLTKAELRSQAANGTTWGADQE